MHDLLPALWIGTTSVLLRLSGHIDFSILELNICSKGIIIQIDSITFITFLQRFSHHRRARLVKNSRVFERAEQELSNGMLIFYRRLGN